MHRTLTLTLALFLVTGAAALAACGGDDDDATATPTPALTPPPIVTQAAAPTVTVTDATPAPTADAAGTATATATAPPAATAATPKRASTSAPLTCMKRTKLTRPRKQAKGVWVGEEPRTGEDVLVNGPYKTAAKARASAESQQEIASADAGGRYVVTAALLGRVESTVHKVAKCLKARS